MLRSDEQKRYEWLSWFGLAVVLIGAAWLRYHLIDVPFERDEGEYAYGGQLLLQGIPPYTLLYNMKLPGIYAAYALLLKIFGQTHTGVHLGLIVVNGLTSVLVYLVARKFVGSIAGVAAAAAFAVLSMGQPVQGVFANAEHFVLLPVMVGAFLLLKGQERDSILLFFAAGFMFGAGFVVKQHGVLFIVWASLYFFWDWLVNRKRKWAWLISRGTPFVLGVFVPYAITCLLLIKAGVFEKFWFWTFEYARGYTGQIAFHDALTNLSNRVSTITAVSPLLWTGVVLGGAACFFGCEKQRRAGFILSFTLLSFMAVCPGGFFRPHYFVLLLPAAALLFGFFIDTVTLFLGGVNSRLRYGLVVSLVSICLVSSLYEQRQFLFQFTPEQAVRDTYWPNPFNESLVIADYIKQHSKTGDRVAIIGSEPQIYFYSGLRSASGYIYMYPLMELHDFALAMQQEMIAEIEATGPTFLIFVRNPLSWLQKQGSHLLVYDWFTRYKENYERVGMIETFERSSRYTWGSDAVWPPVSPYWIEILRKKSEE